MAAITTNDEEVLVTLEKQSEELRHIRSTVEKIRRHLLWGSIISAILFILPLVGLAAAIPWLLEKLSSPLLPGIY